MIPRFRAGTWTAILCALLALGFARVASAAVETYEPTLSALVAPQAGQLHAAGIQSILTRTGKHRRDIQVLTQWGPVYLAWPKGVTPALFEIYIAKNVAAEVYMRRAQLRGGLRHAVLVSFWTAPDVVLAEAVRFELTEGLPLRGFSRPVP